jgi:hypothetical protein
MITRSMAIWAIAGLLAAGCDAPDDRTPPAPTPPVPQPKAITPVTPSMEGSRYYVQITRSLPERSAQA